MVRSLALLLVFAPFAVAAQTAPAAPPADFVAAAPAFEDMDAPEEPEPTLGEWSFGRLCVVTPGEAKPDCAAAPAGVETLQINVDSLMQANSGDPGAEDLTCQRVTDVRQGADGRPVRTWVTVCNGEVMNPRQQVSGRTRGDIPAPERVMRPR
jgi:hypothetical protein